MGRTTYRFASLFCGCGGLDLGFVQAGFRGVSSFDIDPAAIAVHVNNLGQHAELRDLSKGVANSEGLRNLDVLLAGSPCQGFSTAGKRDPADPRNKLLMIAGEAAVHLRPRVVVIENVAGVMAGAQRIHWDTLDALLRSNGYRTTQFLCEASLLGVAQIRKRMVLLAWNTGWCGTVTLPVADTLNLQDVLKDLSHVPNHNPKPLAVDSRCAKIARHVAQGQKLCNVRCSPRSVHTWQIPKVFGKTTTEERQILESIMKLRRRNRPRSTGDADPVTCKALSLHLRTPVKDVLETLVAKGYVRRKANRYDLTHTFNGKYRRLDMLSPSPTVDTRFGDPHYFIHPREHRGFTVREAARIQGFPDSFIFEGAERAQYRMIGNAVPPPMGYALGTWIRDNLLA